GVASKVQRQVRDELLAAGVKWWWLARSTRACLVALHRSGVPLRKWKPPLRLQEWEGPFSDPHKKLPMAPEVARGRRAARRRWRARQRAREPAKLAPERHDDAGDDIAA